MIPGSPEKIEHEYIRHGTRCLTGSFEVATGKIIYHSLKEERKEPDFLQHIMNTVACDPTGEWVFVLDQLNTHKSESLVQWVSQTIGYEGDLGKKRKSGILKSMESRKTFLEDNTHRIRFLFTPKHTSWLNQIEIWFSILSKRLLKRACFSSVEELEKRINGFIDFFNKHLSKPFKWTYQGRVLRA